MPGRQRINIYFTEEEDKKLYSEIEAIAAAEKRSMSQMAKILIVQALGDRKLQNSDESPKK